MSKCFRNVVPSVLKRAVILALLLAAARPACGQTVMSWFDPRLIKQRPVLDYRLRDYPEDSQVKGQDAQLRFAWQEFDFTTPICSTEDTQWRFITQDSTLCLPNNAHLPTTGQPLSSEFYDLRFGGGYGAKFDSGNIFGVSATFGSASDKPFSEAGEMTLSATAFYYTPCQGADSNCGWLYYLVGQTQLNGALPYAFPGVGYYLTSEHFDALLGLPAIWLNYKPVEELRIQGLFIPSRVMLDATWDLNDWLSLFATYDWEYLNYWEHDRVDQDEQLFYMEQRVYAGARFYLSKCAALEVGGGLGFDRKFFEAQSSLFSDHHNEFGVDPGALIFVKLTMKF